MELQTQRVLSAFTVESTASILGDSNMARASIPFASRTLFVPFMGARGPSWWVDIEDIWRVSESPIFTPVQTPYSSTLLGICSNGVDADLDKDDCRKCFGPRIYSWLMLKGWG